jgi:cytoskeletal protein CcmA (bactofilin family)
MFDKKLKTTEGLFGKMNRIAEGTQLNGDLVSDSDIRIDGALIGNITLKGKLVIGPTGYVEGNIKCRNIDVEGKFLGKLEANELLNVKSKANIKGDVIVGKLGVEPGATFTATCSMKGSIKNINEVKNEPRQEEKTA